MGRQAGPTDCTTAAARLLCLTLALAMALLPWLVLTSNASALGTGSAAAELAVEATATHLDDDHCAPAPGPAEDGCTVHCLDWNASPAVPALRTLSRAVGPATLDLALAAHHREPFAVLHGSGTPPADRGAVFRDWPSQPPRYALTSRYRI